MNMNTTRSPYRSALVAALLLSALGVAMSGCHDHNDHFHDSRILPAEIIVFNDTGEIITGIFISPSSDDSWGPNDLGREVIFDGETFTFFDIAPGVYDIAADGDFGGRWEEFDIFLSEDEVFTWTLVP